MVEIRWLRDARNDLKEIYEYIALDSHRYAKLQLERIRDKIEILKSQAEIGKIVQNFDRQKFVN